MKEDRGQLIERITREIIDIFLREDLDIDTSRVILAVANKELKQSEAHFTSPKLKNVLQIRPLFQETIIDED